jgi:hypothetical protein
MVSTLTPVSDHPLHAGRRGHARRWGAAHVDAYMPGMCMHDLSGLYLVPGLFWSTPLEYVLVN